MTPSRIEWRAVLAGAVAAIGYLAVLALPAFDAVGVVGVPLLLATGLVAGSVAALVAGADTHDGGWHGLLSGTLAGGSVVTATVYAFTTPGAPVGVFDALARELAYAAAWAPVVATHGDLVVAMLAGTGWGVVGALGLYAGRVAPRRDGRVVAE